MIRQSIPPTMMEPGTRRDTKNRADRSHPEPGLIATRKILSTLRPPPQNQVRHLRTDQQRDRRQEVQQPPRLQTEDLPPGRTHLAIQIESAAQTPPQGQPASSHQRPNLPGSFGDQAGNRNWLSGHCFRADIHGRDRICPGTTDRWRWRFLWQLSQPTSPPIERGIGTGKAEWHRSHNQSAGYRLLLIGPPYRSVRSN